MLDLSPALPETGPLARALQSSIDCHDLSPSRLSTPADATALWHEIVVSAQRWVDAEPDLRTFISRAILGRRDLTDAITARLGRLLANDDVPADAIEQWALDAYAEEPYLHETSALDLIATTARDPALSDFIQPVLYRKGYLALQGFRVGSWLWRNGRHASALYLHARICNVFGVDIHPAATIGGGVFIDHANGVVIGATAHVGDDCSILHGVTLGGTGTETGDRHPKVGRCVLIGAGATVLGNIAVGDCSLIAAGSVVLADVPARTTVAGVPAKVVGSSPCGKPSAGMDHTSTVG